MPKTNEEYISVKYVCIRFVVSYRILSSNLDSLVKTLVNEDFKILKKDFWDEWEYLIKKLVNPYEFFISIDEYKKLFENLKKESFFIRLKKDYPNDSETERTK